MAWHSMFRVVPFAFSVEKSTPAGKMYASGVGGAGDQSQLCVQQMVVCFEDSESRICCCTMGPRPPKGIIQTYIPFKIDLYSATDYPIKLRHTFC